MSQLNKRQQDFYVRANKNPEGMKNKKQQQKTQRREEREKRKMTETK